MLTSLLSLYIASQINSAQIPNRTSEIPEIINTASANLSSFLEKDISPIKKPRFISPIIKASSSIAVDLSTNSVLYENNSHLRLPLASITKLMTVHILLLENGLDEEVTVSSNAANTEGSTMWLRAGEKLTVSSLINGAMINSANDAAVALAEHNAGTVSAFVEKMNNKAKSMGLLNTHFANPIGLDQNGNYSSTFDIAKMSTEIYKTPFIQIAAQTKELEVFSTNKKQSHKLISTNDLLDSYLNIKGLKTGRTEKAGLCLVSIAQNEEGKEILTVVLNSPARFTESKILIDWIFRAFNWPS